MNNNNIINNNNNSKIDKNTISNKIIIIINLLLWNVTTKFIVYLELLTSELSVLWFVDKKNRK